MDGVVAVAHRKSSMWSTGLSYGLSTVIGVCVMSGAVGFAHDSRFVIA